MIIKFQFQKCWSYLWWEDKSYHSNNPAQGIYLQNISSCVGMWRLDMWRCLSRERIFWNSPTFRNNFRIQSVYMLTSNVCWRRRMWKQLKLVYQRRDLQNPSSIKNTFLAATVTMLYQIFRNFNQDSNLNFDPMHQKPSWMRWKLLLMISSQNIFFNQSVNHDCRS